MSIVPPAHKARRIKIPGQATVGQAFALIGKSCLAHLRANESRVRTEGDIESIHQLRVSVRRLRSALALFRDMIPDGERSDFADRLKWIAGQCAEARDWDVFQDELLVPLRGVLPGDPALASLTREVGRIRRGADGRAASILAGTQCADSIARVETWLTGGQWRAHATAVTEQGAVDFARPRIQKLYKRLRKLGDDLGRLDEAGQHDLRIRAKKLRYAIDFLGGLYPGKAVRGYRNALEDIQDCLGALNDAAVTRRLLKTLEQDAATLDPAAFARAAAFIAGWNAARQKAGLDRLPGAWRRFANLDPFWK